MVARKLKKILSLYFNCKIVNSDLYNSEVGNGCFYPVCYPSDRDIKHNLNSFYVLMETLKSLSRIDFKFIIFNIDLSDIENDKYKYKNEVKELIEDKFSDVDISLNFNRPSKVSDWIDEASNLAELVGSKNPVLVMFNHDHPYIDYYQDVLYETVSNVFQDSNNKNKLLHFTHIPDVINEHYNNKKSILDKVSNMIVNSQNESFIHNTSIMTAETLLGIWSSMRYSGDYIGRIDWFGVKIKKIKFTHYVFAREFFKHYDGYRNVTGNILTGSTAHTIKNTPPNFIGYKQLVDFYYAKFIETYLHYIQDGILLKKYDQTIRQRYIELIENSLNLLRISYLDMDFKCGDKNSLSIDKEILFKLIRSKVYFNGNMIFDTIYINNILKKKNTILNLKIILRRYIPTILVTSLRSIFFKMKFPL